MAMTTYKHLSVTDTEPGAGAVALNANFRTLADRSGEVVRVSGGTYTSYHPATADASGRGAALSAAISAASAGDTITLGTGTFTLASSVTIPVSLTIKGSGKGTVISYAGVALSISGLSGVRVSDLSISGRVSVVDSNNVRFDNIDWTANSQTYCLHASKSSTSCFDIGVRGCRFTGGGGYIYGNKADRWNINNNIFWYATGTAAVEFNQGGASSTDTEAWSGTTITGNHFRNSAGNAIRFYAFHDPVVSGNTFEDNEGGAINIVAPIQPTISGNHFERNTNSSTSVGYGVRIEIIDTSSGFDAMGDEAPAFIHGNHFAFHSKNVQIVGTYNQTADIQVSGNQFFRDSEITGACSIAVELYKPLNVISVFGNTITPGTNGVVSGGIRVSAASAVDAGNLTIKDNIINGRAVGIQIGTVTDAWVLGNRLVANTIGIEMVSSGTANLHFNAFSDNTSNVTLTSGSVTQSNNVGYP